MSKDGNINDNGSIVSGRKGESRKAYADNYERIFGKKKADKPNGVMIMANPKHFVESMINYYSSYQKQKGWEKYRHETLVDDALYAVAVSVSDKYRYAQGFDKFKKHLKAYLEQSE